MNDRDELHEKVARLLAETHHAVIWDEPWDERKHWNVPKGLFLSYARALDEAGLVADPPDAYYLQKLIEQEIELEQILAPALGYEPYQPGGPGYNASSVSYNVGDRTGMSLAVEAARKLQSPEADPETVERVMRGIHADQCGCDNFDPRDEEAAEYQSAARAAIRATREGQ